MKELFLINSFCQDFQISYHVSNVFKMQYVGGMTNRKKYDLATMAHSHCRLVMLCVVEYRYNLWLRNTLAV